MLNKKKFPFLILIPFFLFFLVFRFLPIILTCVRSIFTYKNGELHFNNFDGFIKIFKDVELYKAILNTIIIFLIYCVLKLPGVILISMLMSTIGKSKNVYIKFMYLPMLVGMFAYGIIFRYMFTYDGIVNSIMYGLFKVKINWFGNAFAAQNVIVSSMLWGSFGINVLMVSNVINKIPKEQLEYAKIEGTSWVRLLFKVIFPVVKPIVFTIVFMSLIETIGLIDVPLNLTQGGPSQTTVTLGYYIYKIAFDYSDFSYAATVGIMMFIVLSMIICMWYIIIGKRKKKHESS